MRSPTNCEVGGTLVAVTVAMLWTGCLAHQQEKAALSAPTTPLPDRLHAMLPRVHGVRWLVHLLPIVTLAMVVLYLPMLRVLNLLQIYAVILFLRAFSFWVTRLPPPRSPCIPYAMRSIYLGGCSDMMYSGHTSVLVLGALFLAVYGSRTAGAAAVLLALVGIALILCTRHHYSADVLVAIYISAFAFAAMRQP
jgi:hypothetical protein